MELKNLSESIKRLKDSSNKRKFKQRIDLVISLRNLNMKKPDNHVDFFASLHYPTGKKIKVCGLVGPELLKQAKEVFDEAISVDEFDKYIKDKRLTKKLGKDYDCFVAQATVMPKVAQAFGKVLGSKGKMPNPKAGCVVLPNANLKPLYDKLQKTAHLQAKTHLMVQALVGSEDSDEMHVADNIQTVYNQLVQHLPAEKHNIRSVHIKLTMGKPMKIDEKGNMIKIEQPEATEEDAKAEAKEEKTEASTEEKKEEAKE